MKIGNFEIPPKKEESSHESIREFMDESKINLDSLVSRALDKEGNIDSMPNLFMEYFNEELVRKFGAKSISKFHVDYEDYAWRENEIQETLSLDIYNGKYKEDIKKIILIKFIRDIEADSYERTEFSGIGNPVVKDNLIKRFKDQGATILEKSFLKSAIFDLSKSGSLGFWGKEERNNYLKSLDKDFGESQKLINFYNEELNKFNFDFTQLQRKAIINDTNTVNDYDKGQDLKPLYIGNSSMFNDYDFYEDNIAMGDYLNVWMTPDILGIYTMQGRLIGWQKRENLKKDSLNNVENFSEIKKEMSTIGFEDLALFKVSTSLDFRDYIQKNLDIDLSKLSLNNQLHFLNFIQGKTEKDLENFKEFINKSQNEIEKNNKLRTFLSIEQGGKEMGDKILTLGEKLPEDVAQKVFTKYGEIINTADKAEEEVKKLYEKENVPNAVFVSIKETLLNKGANLLSSLADKISDSSEKIKEDDILKDLEDIKTSTIIMGQSYIELYKQGIKVPIEDIANTTLEKISAQNLSEGNKKELVKVYENGRPKETYENEEHIKLLKDEFEEILNNKDTFVFNIRFNNEIVAFTTFYKENEETLHIGGLTFIDDVRNPAVGNAVMVSIINEFKNFNIKALVHSQNKVLAMYQKRFGFKIVKELPLEENAGELYYEIEKKKVSDGIQIDITKEEIEKAA